MFAIRAGKIVFPRGTPFKLKVLCFICVELFVTVGIPANDEAELCGDWIGGGEVKSAEIRFCEFCNGTVLTPEILLRHGHTI